MEPESLLLSSHQPSNDPYPEPDQTSYLSKIHRNIVLLPTSWSS
jgi:hypothetical protein